MIRRTLIAVFGLFCLTSANAATKSLTVGGGWEFFEFGNTNSNWEDTFTLNTSETTILTVTDYLMSGDIFSVLIDTVYVGDTSFPTAFNQYTADLDEAVANSTWSTGTWILGPGVYSITGAASFSVDNPGYGGIRADPVPIPAAAWLFVSGALGLLGFRRRRS
jgi:hypothetical protein